MCIVMNVFFVYVVRVVIQAATQPAPQIHMIGPLALMLASMFGIVLYYLWQFRAIASGDDSDATNV